MDILHCNDVELLNITRRGRLSEGLDDMVKSGVKMLVVSLGSKGAILRTKRVLIKQHLRCAQ